jgi:hypothetical protein
VNSSNLRALSLLIVLTTIMMGCASQPSTAQIPTVENVSPQSVKAGGPTFTLTVIGNHFTDNSTILWNGAPLRTVAISGTELQATVATKDIAIAGTALISVRYPAPENLPELTTSATKVVFPRIPTQPIISTPGQSFTFEETPTKSLRIISPTVSAPNITTTFLPATQVSQPYNVTLTARNGIPPYTWSLMASSGSLPAGLTLTASGVIAGRPTVAGQYNFAIEVTDASGLSATRVLGISVTAATNSLLNITTTSLLSGQVSEPYYVTLAANGGNPPYTWGLTTNSGALPAGLTLTASGVIAGRPTVAGQYSFAIEVTDASNQSATRVLSLSVSAATNSPLIITTTSLSTGQVSEPYNVTLAANGGNPPYTWGLTTSSGALPPGLTLTATTGNIFGTPSASSQYTFTVQVTDSSSPRQTVSKVLSITTFGGSSSLDQYGGREDINCASVTPYFHLENINSHWWFCDPLGHGFIAMSVGGVGPISNPTNDCQHENAYSIYAAKYGGATYNWGWETLRRMTNWGFNSVGQDSIGFVLPTTTCSNCVWPGWQQPIPLPHLTESKPAEDASINLFGYLTSPIKDEISGTNNNYTAWRGAALYDVFDPGLNTWWQNALADTSQLSIESIRDNNPYILGVFTDDSDYFWGSGAGPDFPTGHTNANIAWMTLITSPVQTFIQTTPFGQKTFLYQTTQNYSKTLATNPTTPCSTANPCSLRDYLWQEYGGSIANLNKAWGANYTTFDSTGTQVTGEAIGTADGSKRAFIYSVAHTPVSPYSVLISLGGTAEIGDCPWFHQGCGTTTANTGALGSPTANYITQAESSINYSTGTITITFVTPPAAGTPVTINYIHDGWMAGGTGVMDEDGSHTAWVGTNPFCLEGPDPNYPTYFSCVGGGGTNNAVPNANPTLGTDLDNWVPQMAAKYFKTMHDDLKAVSNLPYLGLDTLGSWNGPAYSKFLEGAAPYLDGAYVSLAYWAPTPSPATFQSVYQYTTRYLGDVPLLKFGGVNAQSDSSMYCFPAGGPNIMPDQTIRGQVWYNTVSYLLTTPGYNGTYPFVGFDWWTWQDSQNLNQGLVSIRDNAYDGHEAVSAIVPCSPPLQAYTCGGEARNYGDVITQIQAANLIWLTH